jgi:hypothetical protein
LDATRVWWRIQLDPESRAHDAELSQLMEAAIAAANAWAAREPERAESWFYLGAAYGVRVQWRVLRGQRLAAARDGKRIKEALETALRLDPSLEDANFGIGLYQYYAAVAPAAARVLRWLFLLPGGDRAEGLARMLRAREHGQLLTGEADYQLHIICLWYEKDYKRALKGIEALARRYPGNPLFLQMLAEVHSVYFHDVTASARTYERLLSRARRRRVNEPDLAEVQARLGLARELDAIHESDRALEHARAVIAAEPSSPAAALATAWFLAGRAQQHLGDAAQAATAFRTARSLVRPNAGAGLIDRIEAAERQRIEPSAAEAYRAALVGWRAFERKAFAEAEEALARAVALRPDDMVSRFRYGRVLHARHREKAAREQWEVVAGAGATTPGFVFAEVCVALATLIETEDPERALTLYERAAQTFGGFVETRNSADRHAARLRHRSKR